MIPKSKSNFIYSSKLPTIIKETKFELHFGNLIKMSNIKVFVRMNSILKIHEIRFKTEKSADFVLDCGLPFPTNHHHKSAWVHRYHFQSLTIHSRYLAQHLANEPWHLPANQLNSNALKQVHSVDEGYDQILPTSSLQGEQQEEVQDSTKLVSQYEQAVAVWTVADAAADDDDAAEKQVEVDAAAAAVEASSQHN